jgi:hypothetical protein
MNTFLGLSTQLRTGRGSIIFLLRNVGDRLKIGVTPQSGTADTICEIPPRVHC